MLRGKIRSAFTRHVWIQQGTRKKLQRLEVPPSEKLVLGVYFAIAALIGLIILEVAHMAFLGSWNSEVFAAITLTDVNKEARTITINRPVKGHSPRIVSVSAELIRRLEMLPKNTEKIFDYINLYRNFYYSRKVAAHKLGNLRLVKITFITFRHWKGTMEYHRTKDILYVQKLLGHKNIQNTLIYINLEAAIFRTINDEFTVRVANNVEEACRLIETGFEYVTGEYTDGGKIFRKRK